MTDLYLVLGLDPSATADAIVKAFRKLAMQHHPDREGGNKDAFQEVQEAYAVLGDPERRAQYDAGGGTGERLSPEQAAEQQRSVLALSLVRSTFIKVLLNPQVDPDKVDVLAAVRDLLKEALKAVTDGTKEQIRSMEARKAKAEKAAARLSSDEGMLNDLLASIAAEMDGPLAQARAHLESETDQISAALDLLKAATYAYDKPQAVTFSDVEAVHRRLQELYGEQRRSGFYRMPPGA